MGSGKGRARRARSAQGDKQSQSEAANGALPAPQSKRWPEYDDLTPEDKAAFMKKRELSPSGTRWHDVYYLVGDAWLCTTDYLEEIALDPETPMRDKLLLELETRRANDPNANERWENFWKGKADAAGRTP